MCCLAFSLQSATHGGAEYGVTHRRARVVRHGTIGLRWSRARRQENGRDGWRVRSRWRGRNRLRWRPRQRWERRQRGRDLRCRSGRHCWCRGQRERQRRSQRRCRQLAVRAFGLHGKSDLRSTTVRRWAGSMHGRSGRRLSGKLARGRLRIGPVWLPVRVSCRSLHAPTRRLRGHARELHGHA